MRVRGMNVKIGIIMHYSEVGINLKMKAPASVKAKIGTITHGYNIFNQSEFYHTVARLDIAGDEQRQCEPQALRR